MPELLVDRNDDGAGEPRTEDGPAGAGRTGEPPTVLKVRGRTLRLPSWAPAVAVAGAVAMGVIARFVTSSNLWLDEALSVNIATLPPGDLLEALRHDGHPPLYYLLLHYWTEMLGDGDMATRALSGVFAVASLPLAWVAGRRLGGPTAARWSLVLVALSPYWVRYATEARMYALVMLLVLAGYLLLGDALERPAPARLAGLALISGLLLLTHYWSFWLLGALGLLLIARVWRRPDVRGTTVRVIAAVAAGGVLFLPWLPSFLYQSQNTGTPWAGPVRPLAIVQLTLSDLGGGQMLNESFIYGATLLVLVLLALLARRTGDWQLTLDLRTVPGVRIELATVAVTAALGGGAAYLVSSTFQPRYAAVFVPLLFLVAAVGLTRLPGVARVLVGGGLALLSLLGILWHLYYERTQSGEVAAAASRHAEPGDLVVYCPDQLGPGYGREMPGRLVDLAYPELDSPDRVDWVDYAERNAAVDVDERAEMILDRAGDGNIFVVWRGSYETFGTQCEDLLGLLGTERTTRHLVSENQGRYYEPANLTMLVP